MAPQIKNGAKMVGLLDLMLDLILKNTSPSPELYDLNPEGAFFSNAVEASATRADKIGIWLSKCPSMDRRRRCSDSRFSNIYMPDLIASGDVLIPEIALFT